MARIGELDEKAWEDWVSERPKVIQNMCKTHPPDRLYEMDHGQKVTIRSYAEDGTLSVVVHQDQNPFFFFPRTVFGVKPKHLTECDIPDDFLGS